MTSVVTQPKIAAKVADEQALAEVLNWTLKANVHRVIVLIRFRYVR